MFRLFASLVFLSLTRLSAAQFNSYPVCVQPLLYRSFPASCLSFSLVQQNTCLCQDAATFGSTFISGIAQACGCADLETTTQLTVAYCNQVGIDLGPAFDVFIQDDTTCDGGTGSGSTVTGGASTPAGGSTATVATNVATTPTGGSPGTSTGGGISTPTGGISTPAGGSTNAGNGGGGSTPTGGNTVTVTAGGSTSTVTAGSKTSGANTRLVIEPIVGIVVGVSAAFLALQC